MPQSPFKTDSSGRIRHQKMLLSTKLHVPSPHRELVSRSRLFDRLDVGLRRRLTLVSAPAGFGKTTLLAEWVARCQRAVAWLSLDRADNDLTRFLDYLFASLPREARRTRPAGKSAITEAVLTAFVNRVESLTQGIVLVLDDYHTITAEPVHSAVSFLLEHLPSGVHTVIVTRADPPLPIARLRARGELNELRQADLRFTPDEAAEFLQRIMGLRLTDRDIAVLSSRTEGWIAGLQMAALSMQGRQDLTGFVAAFAGSNRHVLDYLLEEVLEREPEQVQAFLLQTSILERLSAPLCDAVVDCEQASPPSGAPTGAQPLLEYLERANLFVVPLDDCRKWYRYHHLFADLLRGRLEQRFPGAKKTLHRRASLWYEREGFAPEAIEHALAAGDEERALDLVERNAEATLMRGEVATFLQWLGALPDALVSRSPSLCVLHGWMLLLTGSPMAAVEARLQDASSGGDAVAGQVLALRALVAAFQEDRAQAVRLCGESLQRLPEEDRFLRSYLDWILCVCTTAADGGASSSQALDVVLQAGRATGNLLMTVLTWCQQGDLQVRLGRLHQASECYRQALELAADARGQRLPIAAAALVGLGELAREWNDLDAAERYLREAIEFLRPFMQASALDAYLSLGRVRQARGDMRGARELFETAQQLAARFDVTDVDDVLVAMCQARLWLAEGDLESVRRWATRRGLHAQVGLTLREEAGAPLEARMLKYELVLLARLFLAEGRPDLALTTLQAVVPVAERRGRPSLIIEIDVLQALALQAQGKLGEALAVLGRALLLAQPESYTRVFLDEGTPLLGLLQTAVARGIAPQCVQRLLQAFASEKGGQAARPDGRSRPAPPPTLAEPLSPREIEVLRLLGAHLSSTDVARALVVSVNTARSHVKSIYSKLGVHRRAEAIRRARELGLL